MLIAMMKNTGALIWPVAKPKHLAIDHIRLNHDRIVINLPPSSAKSRG
jgi:hypothetical protein